MNMYLLGHSQLFIFFIVQSFSHHKTSGVPLLARRSITSQNSGSNRINASSNFYDQYPQQEELKKYLPFYLGYLRTSYPRSNINLALWNRYFEGEEEACAAVQEYTEDLRRSTTGCETRYECNYDENRIPSTLISISCGDGACISREYSQPARGSCFGDQLFLNTMKFVPSMSAEQNRTELEGSGGEELRPNRKGRWGFETIPLNQRCICLAK